MSFRVVTSSALCIYCILLRSSQLLQEQEEEVEAVRKELTEAEIKLREANEMELPEETYRVKYEEKKKELNGIMEKFSKMNLEKKKSRDLSLIHI